MKKLLLYSLILYSFSSSAQSYLRMPMSDAHWQIHFWVGPGYPHIYYYYFMEAVNNDTLINGNTYGKVYKMDDSFDTTYMGGLRQNDSSQVFFFPNDSGNEFLLADYNLSVGDTAFNIYYEWGMDWLDTLIVIYKDSSLVGNRYIRKFQFDAGAVWLEGIGRYSGLIENDGPSVSGTSNLLCMDHNDTMWWESNFFLGHCALTVIDGQPEYEEFSSSMTFLLSPNPAHDKFTISSTIEINEAVLRIYNTLGAEVHSQVISSGEETIEVNLPAGMYFVRLANGTKSSVKKLLID
jgi:hypothetical protein